MVVDAFSLRQGIGLAATVAAVPAAVMFRPVKPWSGIAFGGAMALAGFATTFGGNVKGLPMAVAGVAILLAVLCSNLPRLPFTVPQVTRRLSLSLLLLIVSCAQETISTTMTSGAVEQRVVVTATEHSFSPAVLSVNEPGIVEIHNVGLLTHTWSVLASPIASEVDLSKAEVLAEGRAEVGQSVTTDISRLPPGTYQVVCAIPGHFSAGMQGELVVGAG